MGWVGVGPGWVGVWVVALGCVGGALGGAARAEEPVPLDAGKVDLDTLVVPEPAGRVPRTPKTDIRRLLRPGASILAARDRIDQDIHQREAALVALTALEARLAKDLAETTERFEARTVAVEAERVRVRTRLGAAAVAVGASAAADFVRFGVGATEVRDARAVLRVADRERLRVYGVALEAWRAKKADLERRTRNLERTRVSIERLQEEVGWDREEQGALKEAVVGEPEFYAAFAREMEGVDDLLGEKVRVLSQEAPPERKRLAFEESKGRLAPPLANPEVVGRFGTRTYKGTRSVWRGLHVVPARPPRDGVAPARAVYWGYVAWTGWLQGLGQVVILDHTLGFTTIYAHLGSIEVSVGEKVKTGQPLGRMGESESFFGARLYFELRRDGVALDPLPWLR